MIRPGLYLIKWIIGTTFSGSGLFNVFARITVGSIVGVHVETFLPQRSYPVLPTKFIERVFRSDAFEKPVHSSSIPGFIGLFDGGKVWKQLVVDPPIRYPRIPLASFFIIHADW